LLDEKQRTDGEGKTVPGLCCTPISEVRIAVIGLGRGGGAIERLSQIEGSKIVALHDLHDLHDDRIGNAKPCPLLIWRQFLVEIYN
jgi:hypothetical protein